MNRLRRGSESHAEERYKNFIKVSVVNVRREEARGGKHFHAPAGIL